MDPALKEKAHRLKILKSKAAALGNLRAAKHYNVLLKRLLVSHGVIYDPKALKVVPPLTTRRRLLERRARGLAALQHHKVPSWFRPGFSSEARVRTWLRLSGYFRRGLTEQHEKGLLPEYYPAPSYWARKIRASHFYVPTPPEVIIQEVQEEDPSVLEEAPAEDVVKVMQTAVKQSIELADETNELNAEAEEENALLENLEKPGEGKLAAEDPWYNDPNKVFMAAVAGVVALAVIK